MVTTTRHLPHLLMLVVPLLFFCVLFLREWRRTAGAPLPLSLHLVVAGTVGSALIHALVVPAHAEEAAVLGWFFTLLCLAQLVWVGALLLSPGRRLVLLGVCANLAVVELWVWTRAVSVPFGLGPRERMGPADLAATACELLTVFAGTAWLQRDRGLPLAGAGALVEVGEVHDDEQPATPEHQLA